MENLQRTPLFEKQQELKCKMVPFAGWEMPIQFDGIIAEHGYCRDDVAVFDTSHMGEFFFKGDIQTSGINESTSIDIFSLKIGKCKYGFLLNEEGGVIDDLIIYRLSDDELMIVVNASRAAIDFKTLTSRLKTGSLDDRSKDIAKLDIQGPNSKKTLQKYFDINLDDLAFFSFVNTKIFDEECTLSRTGYTGELGFELYVSDKTALKVWDALLENGVKPAGLGARDALRLEMGYSLYGNDLTESITPLEANLGFFLNLSRDFVGAKALKQQKEEGLKRLLIPFKTTSRRSARKDFEAYQDGKKIGFVTSAAFSPILSVGIGLVMVELDKFDEEKAFELRDSRGAIEANKASLPFIKK
ncbi:glycine cleavage system aminomethyltransferase GcvT [Halarcobacter ebronensis]|uniref:aminomethyltransferase n=1 Tax=Halarcobacter ebronensis TaxID=1462615 RepID=A0A4Q1B022_9BACT|nr:glycine cleavage system aminomethyltransferase GcvT [Halarcobacter ebronensis]QKF83531.1 glycine cleavage system, aminomethyltransferase GcvT [Halarcobacter ebronensis]RXK08323.1 glycine cleavage system protein T [Halarcobacter ebronensis]